MKRFYKDVTVGGAGDCLTIELDGRPVLTPARHRLELPNTVLAQEIAVEWTSQTEKIDLEHMPLTRLAATAVDRVAPDPDPVVEQILGYAKTDTLCYQAAEPEELANRQRAIWQPHLDWAARTYDAPLRVTRGMVAENQPETSLKALRAAVAQLTPFELAAMATAAAAAGSLITALALYAGRLDPETAFNISHLEELFQAEKWGEDAAAVIRRATIRSDLEAAARFFSLLRGAAET